MLLTISTLPEYPQAFSPSQVTVRTGTLVQALDAGFSHLFVHQTPRHYPTSRRLAQRLGLAFQHRGREVGLHGQLHEAGQVLHGLYGTAPAGLDETPHLGPGHRSQGGLVQPVRGVEAELCTDLEEPPGVMRVPVLQCDTLPDVRAESRPELFRINAHQPSPSSARSGSRSQK